MCKFFELFFHNFYKKTKKGCHSPARYCISRFKYIPLRPLVAQKRTKQAYPHRMTGNIITHY